MSSFWLKFGRADARSLAEARRAAVRYLLSVLALLYFFFCFSYFRSFMLISFLLCI
jgi:CRISPR/Cas system-associated protein Cas10 (large subunit of type III CRISPR-Cas system)